MTVDEAMDRIQEEIDTPLIDPVKKRKLFGLYQNIKSAHGISRELELMIDQLCPKKTV